MEKSHILLIRGIGSHEGVCDFVCITRVVMN